MNETFEAAYLKLPFLPKRLDSSRDQITDLMRVAIIFGMTKAFEELLEVQKKL